MGDLTMGYVVGDTFALKRVEVEESLAYLADTYGDLVSDVYLRTRVSGVFTRIEEVSYAESREEYSEKIVYLDADVTVEFEDRVMTIPIVYSSSPVPTDTVVDNEFILNSLLIYLNLLLEISILRLYEEGRIGYDRLTNFRDLTGGLEEESYNVDEIVSIREELAYVYGDDLLTRLLDDAAIYFKAEGYSEFN